MLAGRASSYWLPQSLRAEFLPIRSHNHCQASCDKCPDPYTIRQDRAALHFYDNWRYSIGLIGSQEVDKIECFRSSIERYYKVKTSAVADKNLGITVGPPWMVENSGAGKISSGTHWTHWTGGWKPWHWKVVSYNRFLFEAKLVNMKHGLVLRFYSTHLTPGRGKDEKNEREFQVSKLVPIVLQRAQPKELPPIIVGDFNAGKDDNELKGMHRHFHIVKDADVDLIWVGRSTSFPACYNNYVLISTDIVDLNSPKCSDHNSPVVGLAIRLI